MAAPYEVYSDSDVISMRANAAVVKHRAVKLHTVEGEVVHSAAIADVTIGVALGDAAAGEHVAVQVKGVAKLECAAAVTLGAQVMVQAASADGSIDVAAGATANSLGIALQAGSNGDGDVIAVLLNTPTLKGPANS